MKKSDKIKYLKVVLKKLEEGLGYGLCNYINLTLPIMDIREFRGFQRFVLSFHKAGLGENRFLKGVAHPTTPEGQAYRIRLIKRALKSLETPKKRLPKTPALKKRTRKR